MTSVWSRVSTNYLIQFIMVKKNYQPPEVISFHLRAPNLLNTASYPGDAQGGFGYSEDQGEWEEIP